MVGARELGEFAWSIENLLNRAARQHAARARRRSSRRCARRWPRCPSSSRSSRAALPGALTSPASPRAPTHFAAGRGSRARCADAEAGKRRPSAASREHPRSRAAPRRLAHAGACPAPAPRHRAAAPLRRGSRGRVAGSAHGAGRRHAALAAPAMLPSARYPMRRCATSTRARPRRTSPTVRAFLAREAKQPEPHLLPEEVYRACHTLSGSSKMAQARHGIRLAEPLDHWLRRAFSSGVGLGDEELTLLKDCMAAMESVATHLDEPTGFFVNHWQLLERIERAEQEPRSAHRRRGRRVAGCSVARHEADAAGADERVDFDPEVAAIFTDEATELIDASEHALSDWCSQPESDEFRLRTQAPAAHAEGRCAHGGHHADGRPEPRARVARDAGRDRQARAPMARCSMRIQASLDELARMREQVATGQRVAAARAIIARLQSSRTAGSRSCAAAAPAAGAGRHGACAAAGAARRGAGGAAPCRSRRDGASVTPVRRRGRVRNRRAVTRHRPPMTALAKLNAELLLARRSRFGPRRRPTRGPRVSGAPRRAAAAAAARPRAAADAR